MALLEKRKIERWKRPPLPRGHLSGGVFFGGLLIIGGILSGLWGLSALARAYPEPGFGDVIALMAAAPAFFLGVWIYSFSLILQELRHMAFESARRAGEVTETGGSV